MNLNKIAKVVGCWFLIIGLSFFFLYALQFLNIGRGRLASTGVVEIKKGMGFNEVTEELKKKNFIQSEIIFKIYSLISGQARQFKVGRYILPANISIPRLVGVLTDGPSEVSITIVPGMTVREIDERLSALAIIEPNSLINFNIHSLRGDYFWIERTSSLEGFLLPDTYNFLPGSESDLVVRKILDNFEAKALPLFEKNVNLLETIQLASLLEKEIPDYEEARLAAGILIKRLIVGIPLQVDAALIYSKCSGKFFDCPALQKADYKTDSPYNTYLYAGLPPTPISNPGLKAIKAALSPKNSDYWYYLSDPQTKKTIFSKTLDEHNKNRTKYLFKLNN